MWYLHKILIDYSTKIYALFPLRITAYYDIPYPVSYAVRDYPSSSSTHGVIYAGIAFPEVEILSGSNSFDVLFVLDALKSSIFLVVQAIV